MTHACTHTLVGMASSVSETKLANSPWSSKNLIDRIQPKKFTQKGLMSSACTTIFVGVAYLVLEISQLSKTTKFPLLTMDYSPWS